MTDPQPKLSRQELYDKIRETSKDEYILKEMIRLGFWPDDREKPSLEQSLIKRRAELVTEIRQLGLEQALYDNPEKALQALHKARKQQALENREATRQRNNQKRYEKAKHWFERQQINIHFLGEGSVTELKQQTSNNERLSAQGLPVLATPLALAEAMGIGLQELRFLSYYRDVCEVDHYQHFQLIKKSGGERAIAAPMPRLKRAQYWILENLLDQLPLTEQAHGFVKQRSIISNATPHLQKAVVVNMDLQDFFPSITRQRVKGLFIGFGYSEQIAAILANICTAPAREQVELDQKTYFVATSQRCLPQGAPTSPAISNLICRKLDKRIAGAVSDLKVSYTRYADDLTFSLSAVSSDSELPQQDERLKKLFWRVKEIISSEGFTLHPKKTRIMRPHQRQEVTGLVVNQQLSINRQRLKAFRALLFQIDKDGFSDKHWQGIQSSQQNKFIASVEGFANFVAMVQPEKGIQLQKQWLHIKRKYGLNVKPGQVMALNKKLFRLKTAAGEPPRDDWWQPVMPEPPKLELTSQQIKAQQVAQTETASEQPESDADVSGQTPANAKDVDLAGRIAKAMICFIIAIVLFLIAMK